MCVSSSKTDRQREAGPCLPHIWSERAAEQSKGSRRPCVPSIQTTRLVHAWVAFLMEEGHWPVAARAPNAQAGSPLPAIRFGTALSLSHH